MLNQIPSQQELFKTVEEISIILKSTDEEVLEIKDAYSIKDGKKNLMILKIEKRTKDNWKKGADVIYKTFEYKSTPQKDDTVKIKIIDSSDIEGYNITPDLVIHLTGIMGAVAQNGPIPRIF